MLSKSIHEKYSTGLVSIVLRDVDASPLTVTIEVVFLGCATSGGIVGIIGSGGMSNRGSTGGVLLELESVTHTRVVDISTAVEERVFKISLSDSRQQFAGYQPWS